VHLIGTSGYADQLSYLNKLPKPIQELRPAWECKESLKKVISEKDAAINLRALLLSPLFRPDPEKARECFDRLCTIAHFTAESIPSET
jgi:hypothetical protein